MKHIIDHIIHLSIFTLILVSTSHAITAKQSSTGWGGSASKSIDGNTDGVHSHNSVSHTAGYTNYDWLLIDLESVQNIDTITLWNRTDSCCVHRINGTAVMVSDTPFNLATTLQGLNDARNSSTWNTTIDNANPDITLNLGGIRGRYILIQKVGFKNDRKYLSIAEIEVRRITKLNQGQRDFTLRYQTAHAGDIVTIGNTVLVTPVNQGANV